MTDRELIAEARSFLDECDRADSKYDECDTAFMQMSQRLVHDLADALERLRSWDGLMELLDEYWPEDLIPTLPDDNKRDPGPRIVSLIRWVDRARADQMRRDAESLDEYWDACGELIDTNNGARLAFETVAADLRALADEAGGAGC